MSEGDEESEFENDDEIENEVQATIEESFGIIKTVKDLEEEEEKIKNGENNYEEEEEEEVELERVKVIIRCRPMSEEEELKGHSRVVQVYPENRTIVVHRPNPASTNMANAKIDKVFNFDAVYDERISQLELYNTAFSALVDSVLEGFNATIFAYGQTGTGKTYTMEGIRDVEGHEGVIPHSFRHIFNRIKISPHLTYLVRASYLEIYQEEVRDLLSSKLRICELKESPDGVYVKNLSNHLCRHFQDIDILMNKGNRNRSTGATKMNEHSSRSHAIFIITVEMREGETFRVGKLNLVDLAGSERQGKTGSEGERLKEAVKINLSLSALGNVIQALASGKGGHIPYRDSKLTRLLQDSLGGNSRTIMVATVGPASFNYDETMTTLRYASRTKHIKNRPKVNEDPTETLLRDYQEEIYKLRDLLQSKIIPGEENDFRDSRKRWRIEAELGKELSDFIEPAEAEADPDSVLNLLEEKRVELLNSATETKERKSTLISQLDRTRDKVISSVTECSDLHNRINWLESKLINGENTLVSETDREREKVEVKKSEVEKILTRQDDLEDVLGSQEERVGELEENQGDIEEAKKKIEKKIEAINKKIEKKMRKRAEQTEKHEEEMAELKEVLEKTQKESELTQLILESFVSKSLRSRLTALSTHPPEGGDVSFLPFSSSLLPRPLPNYASALPVLLKYPKDGLENTKTEEEEEESSKKCIPMHGIYRTDANLVQLHPVGGGRRVRRYEAPSVDPHIKAIFRSALEDVEKDVVIGAGSGSKKRMSRGRVQLGEVEEREKGIKVRQVLSAKHRAKEIPYKDYVDVTQSSI